jgi:alcohol dehydrogenase
VTVPFVNGCGTCDWCKSGNAQVCPTQSQPGFTQFGSFAEYVEIKNADFNLIPLPDSISFEVAAALGCRFATAFVDYRLALVSNLLDLVAVIGCGGVGLSAVMIAKAFGAKVAAAVDVNEIALKNAGDLGADYFDSKVHLLSKRYKNWVVLTSLLTRYGSTETAEVAVKSLRRLGKHIQLGLLLSDDGLTPMAMARVIGWELKLIGSHGMSAVDYPQMLKMIVDGKLQPELFIKRRISLEEAAIALANMNTTAQDGITIIRSYIGMNLN